MDRVPVHFLDEPERAELVRLLSTAKRQLDAPGPWRLARQGGPARMVQIHASAVRVRGRAAWLVSLHDVTLRVETEQALRRAERYLDTIFRACPAAVGVGTLDGRMLDVNERCCELFGRSRDEMVGHFSTDLGLWVDRAERAAMIQRLVDNGSATAEVRLRHSSGEVREALVSMARLDDADPVLMAIMFVDITDRKRAEQRAHLEEARFRTIVEHCGDAIVLVGADGRVQWISHNSARLLGQPVEGLRGSNAIDFVHPDDQPLLRAQFESVLRSPDEIARARYRMRRANGTWRLVEGTAVNRLSDRAVHAVVLTEHDITDRQRAQDQLERFFTLASDLQSIHGLDGSPRRVNAAWQTTLGWAPGDLVGVHWLELVDPLDREATQQALERAGQGNPILQFENHVRAKDGTYHALVWSCVPMVEEGLLYATARDVTEKEALETKLAQIQRLESIGRLAGGVAHDFNNMLTAISGYAELLDRQLPPDHRGHNDLAEVLRAAERARALTRQLLAFGRKQVLQPQLLDVNDVVTDMVSMLRHLLGEDITIELAREATGKVLADRSQLEQVLVNLAVNARDAMPTGGVLAIRTSDVELGDAPVGAGIPPTPGRHVLLSVSDTGAGMDAATRAHAFEPFFTTKPHGKGTGMGLAQVYGTVKQSGGVIACESEPARGTIMRIYLPAVAAPGEAEPPEPRAARAMLLGQEPAQTAT